MDFCPICNELSELIEKDGTVMCAECRVNPNRKKVLRGLGVISILLLLISLFINRCPNCNKHKRLIERKGSKLCSECWERFDNLEK